MKDVSLFIATPLHSSLIHKDYMAGCFLAMKQFHDRIPLVIEFQSGSWLPKNRDLLTSKFLDSTASHMLCIDSDIGWCPDQVELMLGANKDFISGCYPKKQADRAIPAKLTGEKDANNPLLWKATYVPGGFLLIRRAVIERMVGAFRHLEYTTDKHRCWGLWCSRPEAPWDGEDVAFCNRWTSIGGEIWLHQGVALRHHGEMCYEIPEK